MRKKLAWTAAVGVFVALGFFAAIVIGGRRANHPGMASSPDRKPPAGEALSRVAESPGVRSGRPGGDSEAPVFGKNERNPALPVRLDGPDRGKNGFPGNPGRPPVSRTPLQFWREAAWRSRSAAG